ncbi:MAG: hypothetical protein ACK2UK_12910, partial [Candidatus Promineifilaceae bacterium]
RLYTEVLADPAVQEAFKEATGIRIDLIGEELYAQVVSALYLILPPQRMETAVDGFFTNLTGYLRGDIPELQEDLELGASLTPEVLANRIATAAAAAAVSAVDKAMPIVVNKSEPVVEAQLAEYLDNYNEGHIIPFPTRLLQATVSGLATTANRQMATLLLGPANAGTSPETRLQIEAALAEDDLPTAITMAAQERLTQRITSAIAAAEPRLAESQKLAGISGLALALGQTRDQLVANLNLARGYIDMLQNALLPLAIVLLIILAVIVWLNSDDLGSALRAGGWTLVIASGLVLLLWLILGFWLRGQVQSNLAAAALGPASFDAIVDDVIGSLLRGIWGSIWSTSLIALILGLVFLAFGYSKDLMAFLKNVLGDAWEYKWWLLGGALVIFVLLPLLLNIFRGDARAANQPCNGHVELCDRPINEVAYAASHNSMSIAEYGWIWPMHDGTMIDQLDAGVRALLFDTHYIDGPEQVEEFASTLNPEAQDIVLRAGEVIVEPAQEGDFLCHQLCRLGWSELPDTLVSIREWLEAHPREVVFFIIQDEISAEDTGREIEESGLIDFIYTHAQGDPWPTLRELIDSNERLIVMAENEGPPPDWYTNAWDVTEETPYTFITPDQFSCEPNRGGTGKPFFLLNHWIQRGSPNRVDGAIVNDYDFLLARARQCEQERGKMPNFVAVNWYSQGDLVDVVDTLNGVYQPAE